MVDISEQGFSVKLSARVDGYLAAMEQAKKATKEVGDSGVNFDRLGSKMTDVGLTLSHSVTLPLIAAGGIAVKMSSDYEASFARMEGLAGVTAGEVDGLKKSVLDLAGETAQAPQKLADALYEASSAGLDTEGALQAVGVAAKGAAVGMGSAQDIVGLVASATASYGKENITAAKATDILTASIKAGRADPAELAGSLGRILPIAAQLGVSFDQVGGATAFLSNIMGNTAETVTALQGFFVQLLSPTQQGKQALHDMGTSVEELHAAIDEKGLIGALDLLRSKGFAANQDALRNLFPDVQAFQGALALVSDTSGALTTTLDATKNSTGALDTAFGLASDTAGFKMKQAWAEVQVALIQAGDVILPIVSGIAGAIGDLVSGFSGLPGPVKTIVVAFLGLAAAAGPVLIVAGSLVKNFQLMKTGLESVGAGATTASLALGAIGIVMIAATAWYTDNARKKAELVAITNDFVTALKAEADGQQGAVDASINKDLMDEKLIENAKILGISVSDMARIIRGESVPAYEALQKAANDYGFTASTGAQVSHALGLEHGLNSEQTLKLGQAYAFVNSKLAPLNDGLENAHKQMTMEAEVARDLFASVGDVDSIHHQLAGTIAEVTGSLNDNVPAVSTTRYEVDRLAEAIAGADLAYQRLTGQLDEQQAWENVLVNIDKFNQKTEVTGEDVRGVSRDIADYVAHTDTIPAEKKTEIFAALRDGDITRAEELLANLTRTREIYLALTGPGAVTAPGYGGLSGARAEGGPVLGGQRYLVGERGPEVLEMSRSGGSGWVHPTSQLQLALASGPMFSADPSNGSATVIHHHHNDNNAQVVLNGGIRTEISWEAFWQRANFALASIS